MNHIHLIGRLGADPSITPYRDDKQPKDENKPRRVLVQFDLAVDRSRPNPKTGEIETDWLPVTLFDGPAARFVSEYVRKGNRIALSGRVETSIFETENGEKRKSFRIIADEVMGLDGKRSEPASAAQNGSADVIDLGTREAVQ